MNRTPLRTGDRGQGKEMVSPACVQAVLPEAFARSGAAKWALTTESFGSALTRGIEKHFGTGVPPAKELGAYISGLHLEDLALACACAEGLTSAWDHFVSSYRPYLRTAAAGILGCAAGSAAACDLADSLFADLYGLNEAARSRSLFRYFHGRSSLKTWLRAVLAQRQIDSIRAARRVISIDDEEQGAAALKGAERKVALSASSVADPHRQHYLELFRRTLEVALGLLEPRDKNRLRLYYAEQRTLAEIGRELGEHESSVSRNLERARRELRRQVEQALRGGAADANGASKSGLSDAQIALCFEYAAEDAPIDFDKLFPDAAAPSAPQLKTGISTKGHEP